MTAKASLNSFSDDDRSTQLYWGLGLNYKVAPNILLGASIDGSRAEFGDLKSDVHLYSVGATFTF